MQRRLRPSVNHASARVRAVPRRAPDRDHARRARRGVDGGVQPRGGGSHRAGRDVQDVERGDRAVDGGEAVRRARHRVPAAVLGHRGQSAAGLRPERDRGRRRITVRHPLRPRRSQTARARRDAVPGQRPARSGDHTRRPAPHDLRRLAGCVRVRAPAADAANPRIVGTPLDARRLQPARRRRAG